MFLPELPMQTNKMRNSVLQFGGLNLTPRPADGEFVEMVNMSSDDYPSLSPRKARQAIALTEKINAVSVAIQPKAFHISDGKFCCVAGSNETYHFYFNTNDDDDKELESIFPVSKTFPKQMIDFESKIIIFPDKIYYDKTTGLSGNLDASRDIPGAVFYSPELGDCSITATATTITDYFKAGDAVTVSGCIAEPQNNRTAIIKSIKDYTIFFENNTFTIRDLTSSNRSLTIASVSSQIITVKEAITAEQATALKNRKVKIEEKTYTVTTAASGTAGQATITVSESTTNEGLANGDMIYPDDVEHGDIKLSRKMMDMDYYCAYNGRVWGCKDNCIYGSKYGDPTNWNYFPGLYADSVVFQTATEGHFTGCIGYGNQVLFMKEDVIHRLMGDLPDNFQLVEMRATGLGLQNECHNGLVNVNDVLLYRSRSGIVAYTGGTPQVISYALADKTFLSAVACSDNRKYYACMQDDHNQWYLYVYDTALRLWHREDMIHIVAFGVMHTNVYFLTNSGEVFAADQVVKDVVKEAFEWSATTADIHENLIERKKLSRIQVMLEPEENSTVKIEVSFDGGTFEKQYEGSFTTKKAFALPIRFNRVSRYQIRLSGTGACKIHNITRIYSVGSDK